MAALEPHLPGDPLTLDGPGPRSRSQARLGLYVHVPFCARRCDYCDFATGAISGAAVERYLKAVELEAERRAPLAVGRAFTSVFFGGGTPSALAARHFERLMAALRRHYHLSPDAEITLEANPESVRPALLDAWAEAGVNRLSMGAQSFDPAELEALGRIHGPERPAEAFALARAHGFRRLSLDLMFGFPGHSLATWERTLESALALEPEHLSAYCFIPEADTPMGAAALSGQAPALDPEIEADLYAVLQSRLGAAGLGCYETSNFSRDDAECRHNLTYWLRREWLAIGPSAHGLWQGTRFANHRDLTAWAGALESDRPCDTLEPETAASRADEVVMLGLRLGTGMKRADHAPEVWSQVMLRYGRAFRQALATGRLSPTPDGFRIAPAHRFVADEVIAWLMALADHDAAGKPAAVRAAAATQPAG